MQEKKEKPEKEKKLLMQSAKHCPVHNSLSKDIDIKINFS